jgi:hypothetical protein
MSASLANIYYPPRDRGPGLVFGNTLINFGAEVANDLIQEFILRKFTTNAPKQN